MVGHWCRHNNTTTVHTVLYSPLLVACIVRLLRRTQRAAISAGKHCGDGQMCLSPSPKPHWPPTRCSGSRHKCTRRVAPQHSTRCGNRSAIEQRGGWLPPPALLPTPRFAFINSDSQCLHHHSSFWRSGEEDNNRILKILPTRSIMAGQAPRSGGFGPAVYLIHSDIRQDPRLSQGGGAFMGSGVGIIIIMHPFLSSSWLYLVLQHVLSLTKALRFQQVGVPFVSFSEFRKPL